MIELAIAPWKHQERVLAWLFVEDEDLRTRVPFRNFYCAGESFLIRTVGITVGIVEKIAAIAVNYEYEFIVGWRRAGSIEFGFRSKRRM